MTMHDQSTGRGRRPLRRTGGLLLAATIVLSAVSVAPIAPGLLDTPVARAADPGIQPRVPTVPGVAALSRQVYGYLPYWRLDPGTVDRLDYGLVSTIAFFGIAIMADGNIDTTWRGYAAYLSGDALAVTNAAHARGVRVVPTFQLFDSGSLPEMAAFLGSVDAQTLFIGQALDLMAARSADGANIDFEPMPATIAPDFVAFVQRFGAAMRARFPDAPLVVATSATAPTELIDGLAPVVDQMLVMTYNYRWTGSTSTGAIAPLDSAPKTVKLTLARYVDRVPASKLIMGVPYFGYDWPVTSDQPNAAVQPDTTSYGGVWSVTYASAMEWLSLHPETPRQEDTVEGSAFFTYWDADLGTFRQVYFEDELSAAAKYDYAIATGLAGIGIWTLDGDRGYAQLWNVLRAKFYAPVHATTVGAKVGTVSNRAGTVRIYHAESVRNIGNVPETGVLSWRIVDRTGRVIRKGSLKLTLYPGTSRTIHATTILGTASGLRAGTYRLLVQLAASTGSWTAPAVSFRQPY